jgi:dUTP pyrophosphatase
MQMSDSSPSAIVFEPLHDGVLPPERATSGSAGADLKAYLRGRTIRCSDGGRQWEVRCDEAADAHFELPAGAMALVPLGFRARLPDGFEAQIRPRSGAAFKKGLHVPNAPGTIDADYPEEWMVIVRNGGTGPVRVEHGERIAQVVLGRFSSLEWQRGGVTVTTDRKSGFGSTG